MKYVRSDRRVRNAMICRYRTVWKGVVSIKMVLALWPGYHGFSSLFGCLARLYARQRKTERCTKSTSSRERETYPKQKLRNSFAGSCCSALDCDAAYLLCTVMPIWTVMDSSADRSHCSIWEVRCEVWERSAGGEIRSSAVESTYGPSGSAS